MSLNEPGLGWIFIILVLQFIVGNIILVMLELKDKINFNRFIPRIKRSKSLAYQAQPDVDSGVKNESIRIQSLNTKELTEPVVVKNLVKKFKKNGKSFSAVDNINFGIGKGKCFGYLKKSN